MKLTSGLRQALLSAAVFCVVIVAVSSVDPRVREQMENLLYGGNGVSTWDNRASELGHAVVTAVRYQSIDNAPMMIFAAVGAVLFVFMVRT
jgi:hypothetical protein